MACYVCICCVLQILQLSLALQAVCHCLTCLLHDIRLPLKLDTLSSLLERSTCITCSTRPRSNEHQLQDLLLTEPDLAAGFQHTKFLVMDEADRLLESSFESDLRAILTQLPAKRQTLLFSATMTKNLVALQKAVLHDAFHFQVILLLHMVYSWFYATIALYYVPLVAVLCNLCLVPCDGQHAHSQSGLLCVDRSTMLTIGMTSLVVCHVHTGI